MPNFLTFHCVIIIVLILGVQLKSLRSYHSNIKSIHNYSYINYFQTKARCIILWYIYNIIRIPGVRWKYRIKYYILRKKYPIVKALTYGYVLNKILITIRILKLWHVLKRLFGIPFTKQVRQNFKEPLKQYAYSEHNIVRCF